jgi:hypothetical protein
MGAEPFRTAAPQHLFRRRGPRWLANFLAPLSADPGSADDGSGDTYEVTFARYGRAIEIVTVQARSEESAIRRAERYLYANIYPMRTEMVQREEGGQS